MPPQPALAHALMFRERYVRARQNEETIRELRSTCTAASRSLEHHDYEGDIKRDDALSAVIGFVPVWSNAEVKFRQAQTLLGRDVWNSMVARAVHK